MVYWSYKFDGKDKNYKMDENYKGIIKRIRYFLDKRIVICIIWK